MKTVLITRCCSGCGLETARHFHAQGWNVVATMRGPRDDLLPRFERMRVLALDVTSPQSIAAALEAGGPIDVLVNNAAHGPWIEPEDYERTAAHHEGSWWPAWQQWLAVHSSRRRTARPSPPGAVLGDAPGEYVLTCFSH